MGSGKRLQVSLTTTQAAFDAFRKLDTDCDGSISKEEWVKNIKTTDLSAKLNFKPYNAEYSFTQIDKAAHGRLTWHQFIDFFSPVMSTEGLYQSTGSSIRCTLPPGAYACSVTSLDENMPSDNEDVMDDAFAIETMI